MTDKLQELLQRINDEGVTKAKDEAQKIISQATVHADEVRKQAEMDAQKIITDAKKKAEELSKNTASDVKMAAQQTITALKQRVSELIQAKAIDSHVTEAFNDVEFVKTLLLETVKAWHSGTDGVSLTFPVALAGQLDNFLQTNLKQVLKGEMKIEYSPAMKNGFILAPLDGTYKLSFTDEDFANLFKAYLRPKTYQVLFNE